MGWFRRCIRHGSWLALLALATNLALSFGHVHVDCARGERVFEGVLLSAIVHHPDGQGGTRDDHDDDVCPICLAAATLGNGVAAPPPVLAFDIASVVSIEQTFTADRDVPQNRRAAFLSRAPPIS